ncbi:MAG: sulfite exporter TauE/SafE family protein, partial [Chlorobi bacterium]|nr:sulfite exporter TauE/SafE family protein [Chlorobiota bacterium]
YMIIFGLGTIPVLLAIPLAGNLIGAGFRKRYKFLLNWFIVFLGVLFILRGLSLGIPYVSPPKKMLKPHEKMMQHDDKTMKMDSVAKYN